jgi:hypothetical protein
LGYLWSYMHGADDIAATEACAHLEVVRLYSAPVARKPYPSYAEEEATRKTQEAKPAPAPIHVSVGCMKESNGRETWMVMLTPSPDTPLTEAFQVYSSASEGRARYTAADLLHRMGLGPMPDPTAFDTELPAAPAAPALAKPLTEQEVAEAVFDYYQHFHEAHRQEVAENNFGKDLAIFRIAERAHGIGIAASKGEQA